MSKYFNSSTKIMNLCICLSGISLAYVAMLLLKDVQAAMVFFTMGSTVAGGSQAFKNHVQVKEKK